MKQTTETTLDLFSTAIFQIISRYSIPKNFLLSINLFNSCFAKTNYIHHLTRDQSWIASCEYLLTKEIIFS
jgi:hypothetical protein